MSDGRRQHLDVKATWAVDLFAKHLSAGLPHPAHVIHLMQFKHDSDGLRLYKRQTAEALVGLLESNGGHVLNGHSQAVELLEDAGYTVLPPGSVHLHPAASTTEAAMACST